MFATRKIGFWNRCSGRIGSAARDSIHTNSTENRIEPASSASATPSPQPKPGPRQFR